MEEATLRADEGKADVSRLDLCDLEVSVISARWIFSITQPTGCQQC